ncbi:hypothetical protein CHRY9390_02727 [Chryseobacterium aquaeductus]|uniref:Uncharacterized protein n=1 Tax=Chryseobacterium aquaeductus TaxID=2675056 RepID=A0A9N8QRG2_9FLAO|nr:hypothetical protein CHRY9390_02727 [Chryseobacterium potabilaquae]CAD7813902.1 hypothetical protein CHRY9390_02727 [Chryseobacterium aquaeductus]
MPLSILKRAFIEETSFFLAFKKTQGYTKGLRENI